MSQSCTRFALALLAATCLTPVTHAAPGDPLGEEFQILWRNAATGKTVLWQMDGFEKIAAQGIGTVNSSWQIE